MPREINQRHFNQVGPRVRLGQTQGTRIKNSKTAGFGHNKGLAMHRNVNRGRLNNLVLQVGHGQRRGTTINHGAGIDRMGLPDGLLKQTQLPENSDILKTSPSSKNWATLF
jgi:hypothetical protein